MSREPKSSQLFTSWKEIADYLRIAVRTAQIWEREKGLPVHRMPGEKGRVTADRTELDQWRRSVCRIGQGWSNSTALKIYAAISTMVLIAAMAYLFVLFLSKPRNDPPAGSRATGESPHLASRHGNELFTKTRQERIQPGGRSEIVQALRSRITFADVDGDNRLETVLDFSPINSPAHVGSLGNFSGLDNEFRRCTPPTDGSVSAQSGQASTGMGNRLATVGDGSFQRSELLFKSGLPTNSAKCPTVSPGIETDAAPSFFSQLGNVTSGVQPTCAHCQLMASSSSEIGIASTTCD